MRGKYTKEFKLEAIALSKQPRMTVPQTAKDLGCAKSMLYKWIKELDNDPDQAFPGKGRLKPRDEEVRQLQQKVKLLEMERDILKKATTFFALENRKGVK